MADAESAPPGSAIVIGEARFSHDGPLGSGAKILIAVNWARRLRDECKPDAIRECHRGSILAISAAFSIAFQRSVHPRVARIASPLIRLCWDVSQPSAASTALFWASSIVSPWVAQPSDGMTTVKPPSASGRVMA
jgi:hypothetical protein